jgi:hypothetical protein
MGGLHGHHADVMLHGLTAFRFAPRNSARAWAAVDSAGDGWGQPGAQCGARGA